MKITPTILSLPPYLSTTWKNIATLQVRNKGQDPLLIVTLQNFAEVEIPHLDQQTIDAIFEAHTQYTKTDPTPPFLGETFSLKLPLEQEGDTLKGLTPTLEHNPNQADLSPLPAEILKKITQIAKIFGLDETSLPSPPEPDCNCLYCQLIRAFHAENEPEEIVEESDLHFRDWEAKEISSKLYEVTNPLDQNEHYQVFLGDPLGCTCGAKNCEHIRAVLQS